LNDEQRASIKNCGSFMSMDAQSRIKTKFEFIEENVKKKLRAREE
jgi:hypothetical protein